MDNQTIPVKLVGNWTIIVKQVLNQTILVKDMNWLAVWLEVFKKNWIKLRFQESSEIGGRKSRLAKTSYTSHKRNRSGNKRKTDEIHELQAFARYQEVFFKFYKKYGYFTSLYRNLTQNTVNIKSQLRRWKIMASLKFMKMKTPAVMTASYFIPLHGAKLFCHWLSGSVSDTESDIFQDMSGSDSESCMGLSKPSLCPECIETN